MPLSARARVELYVPERNDPVYKDLLNTVVREFTDVFGGCTIKRANGSYMSDDGSVEAEPVLVVYTDTEFDFQENFAALGSYSDKLRSDVYRALDEEEILVAVWPVYHSV